jgi:hypothetical protein
LTWVDLRIRLGGVQGLASELILRVLIQKLILLEWRILCPDLYRSVEETGNLKVAVIETGWASPRPREQDQRVTISQRFWVGSVKSYVVDWLAEPSAKPLDLDLLALTLQLDPVSVWSGVPDIGTRSREAEEVHQTMANSS